MSGLELDGTWTNVRGVMRWSPDPTPSEVTDLRSRMKPTPRRPIDAHKFIACPICFARADERCRSVGGNARPDHMDRLVSVRCPCGVPVAQRKQYCEPCRGKARLETYRLREVRRPTRERRAS